MLFYVTCIWYTIYKYKIEQNVRDCQNEETVIDKNLKKYFKRLLKDPLNSDIIQIKTLKANRTEWIKFFANPEILKTILRCLSTNYLLFQKYYIKTLIKDNIIEAKDVTKLIQEKIVLTFFEDIYLNVIQQNPQPTVSNDLLDKIAFLTDTNNFLSDSEQLDKHFRDCGNDEKNEVTTFFLLNMLNLI